MPVSLLSRVSVFLVHVVFFALTLAATARSQGETARSRGTLEEPSSNGVGSIKGKIVDAATMKALPGVNIIVLGSGRGVAADIEGAFTLHDIPVGIHRIKFQHIGYEAVVRSDISVRPGRITFLEVALNETIIETGEVVVTANYFTSQADRPVSVISLKNEEIRRAPGSAGDVSRVLTVLPSVGQVSDNANDLVVRGGSPIENGFYVDGMQVPNINHFPVQGSSGGAIGILNVDFIDDVTFYSGGFPAVYGDRLSSITNITFREGNREVMEGQLDLGMAGVGGVLEGPLPSGKGSWFISGRHSYLDMISSFIDVGGTLPRYGDVQGKVVVDLDERNRLSLLNIFGASISGFSREEAVDEGVNYYGPYNAWQNTVGINWRLLRGSGGYSTTSLSYSFSRYDNAFNLTTTGEQRSGSDSYEGGLRFRNVNYFRFGKRVSLEAGMDASLERYRYDYFVREHTDHLGQLNPGLDINREVREWKSGLFALVSLQLLERLTFTAGLRGDYFSYNEEAAISPRLSFLYQLTDRLALRAAAGMFRQQLPMYLLTQYESNRELPTTVARHIIVGVDYMLTADTKLTLEGYGKEYLDFPLTPADPSRFVVDDGRFNAFWSNYPSLRPSGQARAYGAELLLQKKLARDLYGIFSASLYRTRYRDLDGIWRDRDFDNRYLVSIAGGYKPSRNWEFSVRWSLAGGAPYTPFDKDASTAAGTGILDGSRIQGERYDAYHKLDIRIDRRFYFRSSNIALYLSVWNVYNRQNVSYYYWNEMENRADTEYQFSLLPMLGVEYEF